MEVEGRRQKARALLDSGSHITFASSRLVSSLKAKKTPSVTLVSGIEQTSAPASKFKVDLTLRSIYDDSPRTIDVRAAVVDTITGDLPERALPGIKLRAFVEGLQLADPNFDRPGRIDLLLGMDIFTRSCWPGGPLPKMESCTPTTLCSVGWSLGTATRRCSFPELMCALSPQP